MDLTVAAFDDPSRFKPTHHFGAESMHRAWLNTEGLPGNAHRRTSAAGRQMGGGNRQVSGVNASAPVSAFDPLWTSAAPRLMLDFQPYGD